MSHIACQATNSALVPIMLKHRLYRQISMIE